jgi:hypothetical protein
LDYLTTSRSMPLMTPAMLQFAVIVGGISDGIFT